MRGSRGESKEYQAEISMEDFLDLYNKNMPASFCRATKDLLVRFKEEHPVLFKNDRWSLDLHRKRLIDWLPKQVLGN